MILLLEGTTPNTYCNLYMVMFQKWPGSPQQHTYYIFIFPYHKSWIFVGKIHFLSFWFCRSTQFDVAWIDNFQVSRAAASSATIQQGVVSHDLRWSFRVATWGTRTNMLQPKTLENKTKKCLKKATNMEENSEQLFFVCINICIFLYIHTYIYIYIDSLPCCPAGFSVLTSQYCAFASPGVESERWKVYTTC